MAGIIKSVKLRWTRRELCAEITQKKHYFDMETSPKDVPEQKLQKRSLDCAP
jgi:hypothetical protein